MDVQNQEQPVLTPAETVYNLLSGYRFAQRFVEGKSVADVRFGEIGRGSRLLAETAESVTGISTSQQAVEAASHVYPAPNADYAAADLPELPYPEDHFDVVVALGVIEKLTTPEEFVAEAKRILKPDGLLIISTPDKQTHSNDRNHRNPAHESEMYLPELRETLESRFEHVSIYHQGTVAGSLLFEDSAEIQRPSVENTRFSSTNLTFTTAPPATHFVVAVCGDSEPPAQRETLLILDDERRVYEECEDQREDLQFLKDEIERMQETEIQNFQDALKFQGSENAYLTAQLEHAESRVRKLEANLQSRPNRMEPLQARTQHLQQRTEELQQHARNLKDENRKLAQRLGDIERSRSWRLLGAYRSFRARLRP